MVFLANEKSVIAGKCQQLNRQHSHYLEVAGWTAVFTVFCVLTSCIIEERVFLILLIDVRCSGGYNCARLSTGTSLNVTQGLVCDMQCKPAKVHFNP